MKTKQIPPGKAEASVWSLLTQAARTAYFPSSVRTVFSCPNFKQLPEEKQGPFPPCY